MIKLPTINGVNKKLRRENSSFSELSNISNLFFYSHKNTIWLNRIKRKPFRFFYYSFLSKNRRNDLEIQSKLSQQVQVEKYWKLFISKYYNRELTNYFLKPKKNIGHQKIIWQYWGQGINIDLLPETVKLCFNSVDKHSNGYTVIRLDDLNIQDYLDLPDFIWEKKENTDFKPAFFADLLRLALLDLYGGVWVDATVYLSSAITDYSDESGYFMFQRDFTNNYKSEWYDFNSDYFCWDDSHKVNLLNSIIFSKKNNLVIHTCLDLLLNFWNTQDHIPHYFFFQIMFNCLINDQLSDYHCKIIDDTIPHLLAKSLNKPFNEQEYERIISQTGIHKLTYIDIAKENSFYHYLLSNQ